MNADELKKADEIVRNLHECACEGCPADILDAADLIDSLTAQLNEEISRRYQAECNYDHWKQQALESQRREKAAVEDLHGICRACSNYTPYHNDGQCASCKYEVARFSQKEPRDNWKWRGPQEAEKGEADGN